MLKSATYPLAGAVGLVLGPLSALVAGDTIASVAVGMALVTSLAVCSLVQSWRAWSVWFVSGILVYLLAAGVFMLFFADTPSIDNF